MAKVRVYELAKELGVESKTVLTMLKDMGEFVRSASSTVEPPVERRLKEKLATPAAGKDGARPAPSQSRGPETRRPTVPSPGPTRMVPNAGSPTTTARPGTGATGVVPPESPPSGAHRLCP